MNNKKFILPRWDMLPHMDLYLEQVLSLADKWLGAHLMQHTSGRVMTKTMVNNYVKNQIIAPPVNKKYDRVSVASLLVIGVLKSVYTISDIASFIHLALEVNNPETSYNRFCAEIEKAVESVYAGNILIRREGLTNPQYLLCMIAESFATTYFVRNSFLEKTKEE